MCMCVYSLTCLSAVSLLCVLFCLMLLQQDSLKLEAYFLYSTAVSSEMLTPDDLDVDDSLSRFERDDDFSGILCNESGKWGEVVYNNCTLLPELVSIIIATSKDC